MNASECGKGISRISCTIVILVTLTRGRVRRPQIRTLLTKRHAILLFLFTRKASWHLAHSLALVPVTTVFATCIGTRLADLMILIVFPIILRDLLTFVKVRSIEGPLAFTAVVVAECRLCLSLRML